MVVYNSLTTLKVKEVNVLINVKIITKPICY